MADAEDEVALDGIPNTTFSVHISFESHSINASINAYCQGYKTSLLV